MAKAKKVPKKSPKKSVKAAAETGMKTVTLTFDGLTTDIVQGFLDNAPMHRENPHKWTAKAAEGKHAVSWQGEGEQPNSTYVARTEVEDGKKTSVDCDVDDEGHLEGEQPIKV